MNMIPKEMADKILKFNELADLVNSYFKNRKKTHVWFQTENPLLGGVTPMSMIASGREAKLQKFIEEQLEGNFV